MCGIVGILNLRAGVPPVEEELLARMRDRMTHRGPDACGIWLSADGSVGLGHRRLSIIDLSSAAQQPMSNEDGSVWVVFNGEIYNHLRLRSELEQLGHRYRSHSDTESILHAFEEWGLAAVERLDGMFAFALWDAPRRQLWLVRDRMGKKPLYFAETDGRLIFASEIKAILDHPAVRRAVNPEALWHYLSFAVAPAPLTLFDGIYKLPPATHLLVSAKQPANASDAPSWTFTEYWRPWSVTDDPARSFDEYAGEVRERLQTAVERRLMSDVPFGVFLSGGVDSSANVALMSRLMTRPVDTFSVGFEDASQSPYNEIQYARRVAALFKTQHHEVLISDRHFDEFVDRLAFFQDEPLSDPVCFPLYHVAKLARDHGTIVIQVGEGSDELFAGYDIYRNYLRRQTRYWRQFQCLPAWVRRFLADVGSVLVSRRQGVHLQRAAAGEPVFLSAALAFYDLEKAELRPDFREAASVPWPSSFQLSARSLNGGNPSMDMLRRHFSKADVRALPELDAPDDFLKRMIRWECHQRLGELLLMRLDKMMMAVSVEGRAPFLDTDLVQLAMRIPSSMKIVNGIGKAVLKRAVEPLLPRDLIYRRKIGFCGGSGNMLTTGILRTAEAAILSELPAREWPRGPLERLVEEHRRGAAENSFQIWSLMNLALWLKRWFG
ncbi:MAG: asparagine synthase (glutamine-hydrolyzing) [Verrucomicrobia bacterium]|nr:asparagine synthase (glutamine-hydrolyzing) [Verrucomicrobiota bacterium]